MYHHDSTYQFICLITPLIKQILSKAKDGSLQFNFGTDGIFFNYQPETDLQPLVISIPFQSRRIETRA